MHSILFCGNYSIVATEMQLFEKILCLFNQIIVMFCLKQYIVERHGKTLLPQYLGMYRLTVDGVEHYLVAMRNVFSNHLQTHR